MSTVRKIARKESTNKARLYAQQQFRAPVPVIIKDYYREENKVTVRVIGDNKWEGAKTFTRGGVEFKFPLKGSCHENLSRGIKPGAIGLLYITGWQLSTGYVDIAHTEGLPETPTYAAIRHSWMVG